MSNCGESSSINKTFIIEPLSITGGSPTLSACTALYSNFITSCSGNTSINLGTNFINFYGILSGGTISANTINSDYYYSGGTLLKTAIIQIISGQTVGIFLSLSGGTLTGGLTGTSITANTISATTFYGNGSNLTGINNYFTTAATYNNGLVYFNRNDSLNAYVLDLGAISGDSNVYVTGFTYNNNILSIIKNSGATLSVNISVFSGITINGNLISDTISATSITGLTINANTFVSGGTNLLDIINCTIFSGGSGNCITDLYVTNVHGCSPVTVHDNVRLLNNLNVTGLTVTDTLSATSITGLTLYTNNFSTNVISATTYQNLPTDIFISSGNVTNGIFTYVNTSGGTFSFKNKQLISNTSTGLISGCTVSINSNPTKFNISSGSIMIVDNWTDINNPTITTVVFSGQSGITTTYLTSSTLTHLSIDVNGNILQSPTEETNSQRRDAAMVGILNHPMLTGITSVIEQVDTGLSPLSQYRDLMSAFKLINRGNVISANGTNLKFNKSSGYLFGQGINFYSNTKDPHKKAISATTASGFYYKTQTGFTDSLVSDIDTLNYDLNGVLTAIGGTTRAQNQRVFLLSDGTLTIQYGQQWYTNLSNAIQGLQSENFIIETNNNQFGILIGIISIQRNCAALNDTTRCSFIPVTIFGQNIGGGSGIATTTLQQAYNNSTSPEITTSNTLGALTIINGDGSDNVANLLEGVSSGGSITSIIRADGFARFNTLSATSVSAVTYYGNGSNLTNIPDTFITGSTTNNSNRTYTLTNNTGGTVTINGLNEIFVTGGSYSLGILSLTNNTGNTFNVGGFFTSANDVYTTGMTLNAGNYDLILTRNDGTILTTNLGLLSSDVTITGGSYNSSSGVATFINNTGGTFNVNGFITGLTDTSISSFSYNNANKFSITDSTGGTFNAVINIVTGLTVNGTLTSNRLIATATTSNSISATTISGNSIYLPNTTTGTTTGVIYKNNNRFIHDFNYGNNGTVTTDGYNTFVGINAGNFTMGSTALNTWEASTNTGIGYQALLSLTRGYDNTSVGQSAGANITSGYSNVVLGARALYNTNTGTQNVALGSSALYANQSGIHNIGIGYASLYGIITNSSNIGIGTNSGRFISGGTITLTSSTASIFIGVNNYPLGQGQSNQIVIGDSAIGNGSNTVTIGNSSITNNYFKGTLNVPQISATTSNINNLYLSGTGTAISVINTGGNTGLFVDYSDLKIRAYSGGGINTPVFSFNGNANRGLGCDSTRVSLITSNESRLVVDTGGNVGIGVLVASEKLQVNGNILTTGLTSNSISATTISALTYNMPNTTASTIGVIYKGGNKFIHNFQHPSGGAAVPDGFNTFVGINAGNFTMGNNASFVYQSSYNTALGYATLQNNTSGYSNTAIGYGSLTNNTSGYENVAIGRTALVSNTSGAQNVGIGMNSMVFLSNGNSNIAIGSNSAQYTSGGSISLSSSTSSIYIGGLAQALANNQSNQIVIGYNAIGNGSNTVTIGNSSITNNYFKGTLNVPQVSATTISAVTFTGNTLMIPNQGTIQSTDSTGVNRTILTFNAGDNIVLNGRQGTSDIILNPTSGGVGMYIKGSTGDAGIGSASPEARLHLIKTTQQLRIGYDINNYVSFTVSSSSNLTIGSVSGTSRILFNNPISASSINSITATSSIVSATTISGYTIALNNQTGNSSIAFYKGSVIGFMQTDTGALQFGTGSAHGTEIYSNNVKVGNISSTGTYLFGTGNTFNSDRLQVNGNTTLSSSTSTNLNIYSGAGVRTYLASDGQGTSFGSLTSHNVNIYRANALITLFGANDIQFYKPISASTVSATTINVNDGASFIELGEASPGVGAIWLANTSPTTINPTIAADTTNTFIRNIAIGGNIIFRNVNTTKFNIANDLTTCYTPFSATTISAQTEFISTAYTNQLSATTITANTAVFSSLTNTALSIYGSGTTNPIFKVQGSSGQLMSVKDSLIGTLCSINDISGLPILKVVSDNTVLMGSYQALSLNTTVKISLTAGTNPIYYIPTSAYTGAFIDYTLMNSSGARAGNIMSIWSGTSAQYSESFTSNIGSSTSNVTFSVAVSGNYAVLSSSATTSGTTVRCIIRSI